jgi:serine protease Do
MTSSSIFKANLEFSATPTFFSQPAMPTDIKVKFGDAEFQSAKFIGKDDDKKIAFIKLDKKPKVKPIQFKSDPKLKLGTQILIIQHLPQQFNYDLIVNERFVNAILSKPPKKYLCENNLRSLSDFGLVLTREGKAIGFINSTNRRPEMTFELRDNQNSPPLEITLYNSFKELIEDPPVFKEKETTRKKWLGIYMQPFNRAIAAYKGRDAMTGVIINTVLKDSPAEKAGLKLGDVIISVDGQKVAAEKDNDLDGFRKLIREQKDSKVVFNIFRDGQFIDIDVLLGDTPISQFLADEISNSTIGLSVKELTQDIILAQRLDWETEGVWVSKTERAGWADVAGLRIGDLILAINDQQINGLKEIESLFEQVEKDKPPYLNLFIQRRGDTRFLFIKTNFEE